MTMKQRIMDALRSAGVDGLDEDDMPDDLGIGECDVDEMTGVLRELRSEGVVEDVGCSWVRLSLRTWASEIAEKHGLSDTAATSIEAMLRGDQTPLEMA